MKTKNQEIANSKTETAVFGGGCFWCLEAIFSKLKGVKSVIPGYTGGNQPISGKNPTYEEVCSGKTGHAEVVKVKYDPETISYQDLLSVFFGLHDPTTPNRQGADVGTQYRSIILPSTEKQKNEAGRFVENLQKDKLFENPIVTEIKPFQKFYPAEEYHQKYFEKNPEKTYCQLVISPKINKLRRKFRELMK